MPLSQLNTNSFGSLAITTSQIANNAVTNVQVANNTIGSTQLANLASINISQINTSAGLPSFTTSNNAINFNGSVIGGSSASTMKNRIINGAMVIDQRNAGASVVNTGGTTYLVDRWLVYDGNGGSHFTVQQNKGSITPPVGYTNYLGIQTTTALSASASNNLTLTQYIEGFNTGDLAWGTANAKTVSISFWVYSSLTGTFAGQFQSGNGDAFYVYNYTINNANTWEQKTITITGPTIGTWSAGTNSRSVDCRFDLGCGSTFAGTPNTWSASTWLTTSGAVSVVGTLNATFYITGVQLEVGSTATSFDYRPYGTELALCQRYYYQFSNSGLSDNVYAYSPYSPASYTSLPNTSASMPMFFPVTMRTAPTVSGTPNAGSLNRATSTTGLVVFQWSSTLANSAYAVTAYTATAEL